VLGPRASSTVASSHQRTRREKIGICDLIVTRDAHAGSSTSIRGQSCRSAAPAVSTNRPTNVSSATRWARTAHRRNQPLGAVLPLCRHRICTPCGRRRVLTPERHSFRRTSKPVSAGTTSRDPPILEEKVAPGTRRSARIRRAGGARHAAIRRGAIEMMPTRVTEESARSTIAGLRSASAQRAAASSFSTFAVSECTAPGPRPPFNLPSAASAGSTPSLSAALRSAPCSTRNFATSV